MVLVVLPALIPDIRRLYDVYFSAFKHDKMGQILLQILFPGSLVDSEEFRAAHAAGTLDYWHKSSVQYTFKCVDSETGEIVGIALGDVYLQPRSEEERKFEGVPWLQGEQRERAEKVLKPLWEVRENLFGGQPYLCKLGHVVWSTEDRKLTENPRFRRACYRRGAQAPGSQGRGRSNRVGNRPLRKNKPSSLLRILSFDSCSL